MLHPSHFTTFKFCGEGRKSLQFYERTDTPYLPEYKTTLHIPFIIVGNILINRDIPLKFKGTISSKYFNAVLYL